MKLLSERAEEVSSRSTVEEGCGGRECSFSPSPDPTLPPLWKFVPVEILGLKKYWSQWGNLNCNQSLPSFEVSIDILKKTLRTNQENSHDNH